MQTLWILWIHDGVKTDRELFSEAIASFKCKVDFKEYDPFKKDIEWIQWWSNFRINMASQGLNPVLNPECTPGDTAEGIGFSRMQAAAFGILKKHLRTNMGRAIVRNHQDNLDARAAMAELATCTIDTPPVQSPWDTHFSRNC